MPIRAVPKIAVIFISILLASCEKGQEEAKNREPLPTPVEVVLAEREDISEQLGFTGDIQPWKQANIIPDVPGKVARIYVQEGDVVEKGQLIAELDTRSAKLQLEQAQAQVAVAQANFNDAERNWKRMQALHEKATIAEQQYEKVKLGYEAAEAQLKQAKAALHLAEHQLEVSVMRAPFSGVITEKSSNEGDVINPMMAGFSGGGGVATLMDLSKVKVEIDVSEGKIGKLKVGQRASIRSYPGREFEGELSRINYAADSKSRTFKAWITALNPDLALKAGVFARIAVDIERREDVIVVPSEALIDGKYLFVVEGDVAKRREVMLGLQTDEKVEVVEGLKLGELVVVEGNYGLEDGVKVKAKVRGNL